MFIILGAFNLVDGIAALSKDGHFIEEQLVVGDLVLWGFLLVTMAALQLFTGFALYRRSVLGSVLGVFLAGLSLFAQLFMLPAFPAWALLIMAIDVILIYALTVHGYAFD